MLRTHSKWLLVVLSLCLVVSLLIYPTQTIASTDSSETITLKILHTNDIHSSIDGFGKMSAYIQHERGTADYSLYLDAGDIFSGNPVVDLNEGEPMVDLLNDIGLDAMTIGNHEFDYGQDVFAKNETDSSFPWLSANTTVVDPTIPIEQPEPYKILELGDVQVGIFALTEAPPSTAPAGISGLEFDEDYAAVASEYAFLRDEVDVLIALTHIGYPQDRLLAEQIDFFDLIIGAHSHTLLNQPATVNGTPIAQSGANGANVGNITFTLDAETKEIVDFQGFTQSVSALEEVDEAIQAKVDAYNDEMDEILGQVIGYSNTGLSRDGRTRSDAPLGNFWTDAMRHMVAADIALTNNGGIRDSIPPGEITAGDIYRIEPFANEVMEMSMTGQAIHDVIEYSYDRRNQIDLQTSGLTYEVITDATGNLLDLHLWVDGEPIDLEETYSVAVADYIGTGGSGYEFVGEVIQPSAGFMTNAMVSYAEHLMEEKGALDYTSEGRITITVDSSGGVPGEVIGHTENGLSDVNKALMDASLGNLYTDAVRTVGQADLALLNGSSVTGQIPAGDITDEQIVSLDQFGNEVVVVRTTGEKIKDMILEQSNYYGTVDLQTSGLHYTLVEGEGDAKFDQVQIELEDGTEFDLSAEYTVAYNDYMHGQSFYNLGSETVGNDLSKVYEAVIEYVRNHDGSIDYEEGNRISIQRIDGTDPDLPEEVITVQQAIEHNAGTATVQGYIVGTMYWNFDGEDEFMNTNLLLADDPNERERSKLLPVQLPRNHVRDGLNLVDHPENLGQVVRISGTLEPYYAMPGLKSPTDYEFVGVEEPEPEVISIAAARQVESGEQILIEGTVTSHPGAWGAKGFHIQDDTAGTYIYQFDHDVQPGDYVQVAGYTDHFNGEFQVSNLISLEVLDTRTVPAPLMLTPAEVNKDNEGQLIRLENVTVEDLSEVNSFGTFEFQAVKGNENVLIRVDNRTGLAFDDGAVQNGDIIDVIGISGQYHGTFQVKPRMPEDLVVKEVNITKLKKLVEQAEFKNKGAQKSVLAHVAQVERHLTLAEDAQEKEQENRATQQKQLAIQALEKVQRDIQKGNKGLSESAAEDILTLIELLIQSIN